MNHSDFRSSHSLSATLLLQCSDLLLQVVDHVLLLLVHPACQRHHYQSEHVHFGFQQTQPEEIEGLQLTPQSNF